MANKNNTNKITIDLELLQKQKDAIFESDIEQDVKDGLIEMMDTILDIAEDYNQEGTVVFGLIW